jgi:hypothetical protein
LKYGALPATAATFTSACLLLARDPAYVSAKFQVVVALWSMIQRGNSFGAIADGRLVGFIAWHDVSEEAAVQSIRDRKLPSSFGHGKEQGALLLAAFVAPTIATALPFFRRFAQAHRGKVIFGERHRPEKADRFFWVDRAGRLSGPDLPGTS